MRGLAKLFYLAVFSFVIMFLYLTLNEIKNTQLELRVKKISAIEQHLEEIVEVLNQDAKKSEKNVVNKELKYILQWTNPKNIPFVHMGVGQAVFIERNCQYTNCFVTSDEHYLGDVSKFDVIAFAGTEVTNSELLPQKRSPHQKYVFTNIESAGNYPICTDRFDNFFNWTWTYRLDSESRWGYIIVRDADGNIIGPKMDMHWMKLDDMKPVSEEVAAQLRNKTKAAAWFVSNCRTASDRERYVKELQRALEPYDLKVDIYGTCGPYKCDRSNEEECFQIIKRDYYFYLSFENSFSEDYVTEKLLHGLRYNAIPIVYGGANYTRFMPDGIYLNARELKAEELAKKMNFLIDNPEEYKQYFRWRNHYSYYKRNENAQTDDYCGFCRLLNDAKMVKKTSIYKNFQEWWSDQKECQEFGWEYPWVTRLTSSVKQASSTLINTVHARVTPQPTEKK